MRLTPWIVAALVLTLVPPALAQDQEWAEFKFPEDGFKVNFPGKPQVEETTWVSQLGYKLPARVYRATKGMERYSVTVVDYRGIEAQGIARSKQCPPGAETCIGTQDGRQGAVLGLGYWKMDVRGAMEYAVLKYIQSNSKVTDYNVQFQELVEGHFLQLTNPDESRTFVYITMHENRLYVFEGTTPKGWPEPALFNSSVGFVTPDGKSIRYTDYYVNGVHGLREVPPPPVRLDGQLAPNGIGDVMIRPPATN